MHGQGLAVRRWELLWAPTLAAALACVATVAGLHGVDLPAQLYRVDLFHRSGLTLWDSQWYGGHWTLNYSVIFPPVAGLLGVTLTEVGSAAIAAWTFDRIVVAHFGRSARVGSLVFALGTLAQVAIGQLPFLLGEALALTAFWAGTRRRWWPAVGLGLASSLASPLAGAFLGLAALAWALTTRGGTRVRVLAICAAAGTPVLATGVLFPGQGEMPFPLLDAVCLLGLFGIARLVIPAGQTGLRVGVSLYLLAIVASFVLPTPVGGNISRLGECLGAPLVACALWPGRRRLLTLSAVPIALLQWGPAVSSLAGGSGDQSSGRAYFAPLISFLAHHDRPAGRVEVVPTRLHWEAAYVAPSIPLARGWERQLDTADNPIFYTGAPLDRAAYRAWLLDNGVRYVALPDVPLDYAGVEEGRLVRGGLPGVHLAWRSPHWRVYAVTGSAGIVQGAARLRQLDGNTVVLSARSAGDALVRIRFSPRWAVSSGSACLAPADSGWTTVRAQAPGYITLELGLSASPASAC